MSLSAIRRLRLKTQTLLNSLVEIEKVVATREEGTVSSTSYSRDELRRKDVTDSRGENGRKDSSEEIEHLLQAISDISSEASELRNRLLEFQGPTIPLPIHVNKLSHAKGGPISTPATDKPEITEVHLSSPLPLQTNPELGDAMLPHHKGAADRSGSEFGPVPAAPTRERLLNEESIPCPSPQLRLRDIPERDPRRDLAAINLVLDSSDLDPGSKTDPDLLSQSSNTDRDRPDEIISKSTLSTCSPEPATSRKKPIPNSSRREKLSAETLRSNCQVREMGVLMVNTVEKEIARLGRATISKLGYLKIVVDSLPRVDFDEIKCHMTQIADDQINGFSFEPSAEGFAHAYCSEQRDHKFVFPDFSTTQHRHPGALKAELEEYFQNTVDRPPKGHLPYYIGPPLSQLEHTSLVHAGEKLIQRNSGNLPGINQVYWYISTCPSTPADLHIEDANLGSVNLLLVGEPKIWLIIPPSEKPKLEERIRECFKNCQPCSQFVRHLNLLISPKLLQEWGIHYHLEELSAGEMMVTIPEAYHQVLNKGANFAISVNIEVSASSDISSYVWCRKSTKGRSNCGPYLLTEKEFQLPHHSTNSETDKTSHREVVTTVCPIEYKPNVPTTDIVVIPDDETPSEPYLAPPFMPMHRFTEPSQDIPQLIDFFIEHQIPPGWLNCNDSGQLRKRLERFLPGGWLDDILVIKLLQILCSGHRFNVVDPLNLDITEPRARIRKVLERVSEDIDGLVLPFNVNSLVQSSKDASKNHWVVAVVNWQDRTLTSFGMEPALVEIWREELQFEISWFLEKEVKLKCRLEHLGQNVDGASCALLCCMSVEVYLGSYPRRIEQPSLRTRYLRMLLGACIATAQREFLVNRVPVSLELSDSFPIEALATPNSLMSTGSASDMEQIPCNTTARLLKDLKASSRSATNLDNLKEALVAMNNLALDKRARTLQMIMQCSADASINCIQDSKEHSFEDGGKSSFNGFAPSMLKLLNKIDEILLQSHILTFKTRIMLIELARTFMRETNRIRQEMEKERKIRNRARRYGEDLTPLPEKGQTAETRALKQIVEYQARTLAAHGNLNRSVRERLKTFVQHGKALEFLCTKVGYYILAVLPGSTVYSCDIKLQFPSARVYSKLLGRHIEPSEEVNHFLDETQANLVKV